MNTISRSTKCLALLFVVLSTVALYAAEEVPKKDIEDTDIVFLTTTGENEKRYELSARAARRSGLIRDLIADRGIENAVSVPNISDKQLSWFVTLIKSFDRKIGEFEAYAKERGASDLSYKDKAFLSRFLYDRFKEKGYTDPKKVKTTALIQLLALTYNLNEPYATNVLGRLIVERIPVALRSKAYALLSDTLSPDEKQKVQQQLKQALSYDLMTAQPELREYIKNQLNARFINRRDDGDLEHEIKVIYMLLDNNYLQ